MSEGTLLLLLAAAIDNGTVAMLGQIPSKVKLTDGAGCPNDGFVTVKENE